MYSDYQFLNNYPPTNSYEEQLTNTRASKFKGIDEKDTVCLGYLVSKVGGNVAFGQDIRLTLY